MKKEAPAVTLSIDANGSPHFPTANTTVESRATARKTLEVVKPQKPINLDALAKQICIAHERVIAATFGAFNHAIKAGKLLIEAKDQIEHGKWLPWLEEHAPKLSERTARVYMQVAQGEKAVLNANRQSAADLTIRGALNVISKGRLKGAQKRRRSTLPITGEYDRRKGLQDSTQIEAGISDRGLTVRAEFRRCVQMLALEMPEPEFRQLVDETCREVYGLPLAPNELRQDSDSSGFQE